MISTEQSPPLRRLLPDIPTMLLKKDEETAQKLMGLAQQIEGGGTKYEKLIYFAEHFLHIPKTRISRRIQNINVIEVRSQELQSITTKEEYFLKHCIKMKLTWNKIFAEFDIKLRPMRDRWQYSYFTLYQLMRRLPGTTGHFISIKIFDRSWSSTDNMFSQLRKSSFVVQK